MGSFSKYREQHGHDSGGEAVWNVNVHRLISFLVLRQRWAAHDGSEAAAARVGRPSLARPAAAGRRRDSAFALLSSTLASVRGLRTQPHYAERKA